MDSDPVDTHSPKSDDRNTSRIPPVLASSGNIPKSGVLPPPVIRGTLGSGTSPGDHREPGQARNPDSDLKRSSKGWLGSLGIVGVLFAKFGAKLALFLPWLKFVVPFLKTGLTMVLSIGVYAMMFGWRFAVGFVVLIFVHEMGHLWAAKSLGIRVSAPTFIPFVGAHILLKQALPGAWEEAKIGIAGPIFGTIAAGISHVIFASTADPLFAALAYTGYWLNLFNLIPVVPLDGGRVTAAISPWAWILGYIGVAAWFVLSLRELIRGGSHGGAGVFILAMVLVSSLPRVLGLFRAKSENEARYYSVPPVRRWGIAGVYFGLIAALWIGMESTLISVP